MPKIIVEGDISKFEAAIDRMPAEMREAAKKATKALDDEVAKTKISDQLTKEFGLSSAAAKKASATMVAELGKVEGGSAAAAKALASLGKAAGFGGTVEQVGHLGAAFEAVGPAGIAAAAGLAAVTGGALALTAAGVGAVAFVLDANAKLKDLQKLRDEGVLPEIAPEDIAAIEGSSRAWARLGDQVEGVGLKFAATLAPAVETALDNLVLLGDQGVKALNDLSHAADQAEAAWDGLPEIIKTAAAVQAGAVFPLASLTGAMADYAMETKGAGVQAELSKTFLDSVTTAVGHQTAAVRALDQAQGELDAKAKEAARDAKELADKQVSAAYAAAYAQEQATAAWIGAQEQARAEGLKTVAAFKADVDTMADDTTEALRKMYAGLDELQKKYEKEAADRKAIETETISTLNALEQDWYDAETARISKLQGNLQKSHDKEAKAYAKLAEEKDSLSAEEYAAKKQQIDALSDLEQSSIKKQIAAHKEGAVAAWLLQKAGAAAQILVDAPVITAQFSATIPPPFGQIAASALIAAQLAAVAAAQPPKFHRGGIIPPDERLITAQPGEALLDKPTTRRLGPEGVQRLLDGGSGEDRPTLVHTVVDGRVIARAYIAARRAGSAPDISTPRRSGHRSPYR